MQASKMKKNKNKKNKTVIKTHTHYNDTGE